MAVRIGMLAGLAGFAAFILLTASPQPAAQAQPAKPAPRSRPVPPMFSPAYAEALRDVYRLEEADIVRLERRLAANSDDAATRLKLMAYHRRGDRAGRPVDRARRFQHTLWLIEHHPDSEILHYHVSRFAPSELASEQYRRAVRLWSAAAEAHPENAAVLWNAASFFQDLDPALHLRYLEATALADPNHPFALRPLAHLYASATLGQGPLAQRAYAALESSKNVWVLGNAAHMLQSIYNQSLQMGTPNSRAAALAERYFFRARALDSKLDRTAILPQIDLESIRRAHEAELQKQRELQARADMAVGQIRRLPVEAFPALPPAVAGVLRARNCTVPQPLAGGGPRNVIRGEFFARGQTGWAVLCSVNHSTQLLAFRNDLDDKPDTLTTSEDRNYLQVVDDRNTFGYSREITAVGRDFIVGHYRAYGGPEPPPIDHHGIDDAFLEKSSVTWYFENGKWLRLQGAD